MNFMDILRLSLRNLSEAKLRAGLTTVGVVIGVAVIVTMVSFGLGLQRNTVERFKNLDLFNEITVHGRGVTSLLMEQLEKGAGGDAQGEGDEERREEESGERAEESREPGDRRSSRRALDDRAVEEIARIPGVLYVEPNLTFTAYVRANNRARQQTVGGVRVPNSASRFRNFVAGSMIGAPDAAEVVVDQDFIKSLGYKDASEAVGQTLELLMPQQPNAGSVERNDTPTKDEKKGKEKEERKEEDDGGGLSFFGLPLEEEPGGDAGQEEEGLVARRFRIAGVLKDEVEDSGGMGRGRFRGMLPAANIYAPLAFAQEWAGANVNPLDRVAIELARQSGALKEGEGNGYELATVRVENPVMVKDVSKRLDELGFSSFSLFSRLDELRNLFLILNAALGLMGSISLLVASFGIANTMVMSILERTREIGIMKAIGAEDREIKLIFFVEAAVIGAVGGTLGALLAWGFDKLANVLIYRFVLRPQGASFIDFFSLPPYLWLGAILFAMLVAVLAALYPAARAARIDPVRALRHD